MAALPRMRHIAAAFLTTLATAQQPDSTPTAEGPPNLESLARRVDGAHRPNGPVPPVTAFECNLELHVVAASAKQGGQIDLSVKFLEWQQTGKADKPLIRYEVREAGTPIMRGYDRLGPWQLIQDVARDLRGSERREDLEALQRHMNLAKQLVRCLDPGAVLRSLANVGPVREQVLKVDRNTRTACDTIEGDLPAFPLLQQGGDDAPAHLEVYVDRSDGRLVAIDAWPLEGGKKVEARGERIQLLDLHVRDDLLVPRQIVHLFWHPDGSLEAQTRAVLTTLSLRPKLSAEDFDRPKH